MKNQAISILSYSTAPENVQLLLEGQLLIKNAKTIKKELFSALNQYQNIAVVIRNVIRIDLPVLQLLFALQNSCSEFKKNLSFDIELTGYLKFTLQNSGFEIKLISNLTKAI